MKEQALVNSALLRMHDETGIPLVCTNDCHYLTKEGYKAHDVLMAIQAKTTIYDDKRKKYPCDEFYFKSSEEMWDLFSYIPEALENTVKIADRCNVEIEFGKNKLPPFYIPKAFQDKFKDNADFLRSLVYEGCGVLYGEISDEVRNRIEYEISIVENMGYINYFLIVWDFFRFCNQGTEEYGMPIDTNWRPILTGPGRGSGAGSILLYGLGITKTDPLKYNLLFERFLDPSRISMPDVDSDFAYERRQEVIDYVVRKYGRNSVCQIITLGTMAARSVIRSVGRALDYPYSVQDEIAKMVPMEVGMTLAKALDINPDLNRKYEMEEDVKTLIDIALELEGLPLNTGTHAAGVLIVDEKGVDNYVPCWSNDGVIVTQYNMTLLEELGLLKMDFLGLRTLSVIDNTMMFIEKNHNIKINLDELYQIPDLAPLKLIGEGKTLGIFQLEGEGMTGFMKELRPQSLEDIIAGIALYRPGPMSFIPNFLQNKRHPESIHYDFPELESVLSETNGILVYQEQCMRAVIAIAGYAKSDSDGFRKVISKKKKKLMPLHKKWFIEGRKIDDFNEEGKLKHYKNEIPGGLSKGHPKELLEKFFESMVAFASYCFNKSHAAAYAVVAYITAWFIYNYPTEFFAALMNSVSKNKKIVAQYIRYCEDVLGIEVLPPDINTSSEEFVPLKNGKILFSLSAKSTNIDSLDNICRERNTNGSFTNVEEFLVRCSKDITKQTFEALISIGAFNNLGVVKSRYLAAIDDIFDKLQKVKAAEKRFNTPSKTGRAKRGTFDFSERFDIGEFIPDINEFPKNIILNLEKKYIGLYLSGHPLYDYAFAIKNISNFKTTQLDYETDEDTGEIITQFNVRNGQSVRFIGLLSDVKVITTKAKALMAVCEVEDLDGS
jgi:DNA polymerase-3 subunit alpha